MPRKVVLTGREPSEEEIARELGVSPKRTREIIAMIDAIMDRRDREKRARRHNKRKTNPKTPARRAPRTSGTRRP